MPKKIVELNDGTQADKKDVEKILNVLTQLKVSSFKEDVKDLCRVIFSDKPQGIGVRALETLTEGKAYHLLEESEEKGLYQAKSELVQRVCKLALDEKGKVVKENPEKEVYKIKELNDVSAKRTSLFSLFGCCFGRSGAS